MSFARLDCPDKYVSLLLERAVKIISRNYIGDIDYDKIYFGALSGMMNALDGYCNVLQLSKQSTDSEQNNDRTESIVSSMLDIGTYSVGIIKISIFTEYTPCELRNILKDFSEKNIETAIIDLRDNPGGSIHSLIEVCNLLVKSRPIFYSKDRNDSVVEYKSTLDASPFTKVMLFVNKETKSAAEMLALILQEDGAFVIGQRTYGKSLSQTDFPLGDAILRITTKEYYSYLNGSYNNTGIIPDLNVSDQLISNDEMIMEEAIKRIRMTYQAASCTD